MTEIQGAATPLSTEPLGDLCIRTLAMPADTNANGDIFGGWLLSQMDVGGGVFASRVATSRTVTVAIEAMNFRKAVYVGDLVSVYANLVRVGRTSMTVHLEAWVLRRKESQPILVTDGTFTYVSIDDNSRPQAIRQDGVPIATGRRATPQDFAKRATARHSLSAPRVYAAAVRRPACMTTAACPQTQPEKLRNF